MVHFFPSDSAGTHRESAFVHALLAASVSHGVARACSAGQLGDMCTCAAGKLGGVKRKVKVDWEWGGCSDDIGFGRKVAAALVKKSRTELSRRRKIHLHNFNAGSLVSGARERPRNSGFEGMWIPITQIWSLVLMKINEANLQFCSQMFTDLLEVCFEQKTSLFHRWKCPLQRYFATR